MIPGARKLGFYLVCISVCEIGFVFLRIWPLPWLPRIGWVYLFLALNLPVEIASFPVDIPAACWTMLLGALFIYGKRPLKTYLASEVLLATPSLAFSFIGMFQGDRFEGVMHVGGSEFGFYMLLVMAVFDFIPCWMAIQALLGPSRKMQKSWQHDGFF
jgi:hypothetical protein